MTILKRFHIFLLCLVMLTALVVPAAATDGEGSEPEAPAATGVTSYSAEDFAILKLTAKPNGTPVAGMTFNLYRITDENGDPLPNFSEAVALEINKLYKDIEEGNKLNLSDDNKRVLIAAGTQVNDQNLSAYKSGVTGEDGVAVIKGIEKGTYIVSSSNRVQTRSYSRRGTRNGVEGTFNYTETTSPVPFVLTIPYTGDDGIEQNYFDIDAETKFYQNTVLRSFVPDPVVSPSPTPTPPPETEIPEESPPLVEPSPEPSTTPDPPADPSPTPSLPPDNDDPVIIDDPDVPLIDIPDDPTPLDDGPTVDPTPSPSPSTRPTPTSRPGTTTPTSTPKPSPSGGVTIKDEDVPLGNLPQTGLLWWPVPFMALIGIVLFVVGLHGRKKAAR